MDLPNKKMCSSDSICLEENGTFSFDSHKNSEIFNSFYSNLASNLLEKLTLPKNKFGIDKVSQYYCYALLCNFCPTL